MFACVFIYLSGTVTATVRAMDVSLVVLFSKCFLFMSSLQHPGKGIDVRKRKIWDMYGSQTHLEVSGHMNSECMW